ncbi:MAG: hypothetical protein RML45_15510 [Acetobacteraceae bacterium]|nr:hypothetical protein [Acetobacteraceae bacterium]
MVLIRIAHVGDLPTPGELVRRLAAPGATMAAETSFGSPPPSARPPPGGLRARAGAAATAVAAPAAPPIQASPAPQSLADIAALAAERGEVRLASQLRAYVRPVRVADGLIEFRPEPDAPRDLAPRLAAFLGAATGRRWTVAISAEAGEPSLAERERMRQEALRARLAEHPLVRAILDAFPGASITAVREGPAAPAGPNRDAHPAQDPGEFVFDDPIEPEDQP